VRVGQGFDVHAFQAGGTLVLGGVAVPCDRSLEAHSDGDVVLHALCDALLGAAGLGDIGRHFSPHDATYENIDSRILLRKTRDLVVAELYRVANADITIIAQAPKLSPYIEPMCGNISEDLQVGRAQVNVKATTTEQLGFAGRGEGIAAFAVVLLDALQA
jgi:2-C-methyl-D-erythritol 2,4-cyclodiphosphate synthase